MIRLLRRLALPVLRIAHAFYRAQNEKRAAYRAAYLAQPSHAGAKGGREFLYPCSKNAFALSARSEYSNF